MITPFSGCQSVFNRGALNPAWHRSLGSSMLSRAAASSIRCGTSPVPHSIRLTVKTEYAVKRYSSAAGLPVCGFSLCAYGAGGTLHNSVKHIHNKGNLHGDVIVFRILTSW